MHITHLLISAVGEQPIIFQAVFVELFFSSQLEPILFAPDPALQGALGVLKEELAEPFVHMVYHMPKRTELAVHSLGNVGRKLGWNGLVPSQVGKTMLTTEVSNMPRCVELVNDKVEIAQPLCYG